MGPMTQISVLDLSPIVQGGNAGQSFRSSLALAESYGLSSIAFPAISTGIYGYPLALAAKVALDTVRAHAESTSLDLTRFVCFDAAARAAYERLLSP